MAGVDERRLKVDSEKIPWRWEEGGLTVTRSTAWSGPGCHNGCGMLLYTNAEGKLVKVEADPDHPYNRGRMSCVRCLALPEVVYHPDRLQHPMKRVGARGENKWERISWDEAYDTIEQRLNKIKAEYGAESVLFSIGTARDQAPYVSRLAYSFGSPHWITMISGYACYLPRVAAGILTQGAYLEPDLAQLYSAGCDDPNWTVPECIIVWGCNPVVSNPDSSLGTWVVDCMKRGSKLIVVDPRLTWLAKKADVWLQIRPGTDTALALGMLDIIVKEGLYDKEFVEQWTFGFEQLSARVAEYPVERVSEITWIPKEKIEAAARLFGKSKPANIKWGVAVDMTRQSHAAAQAIQALWTITGNIDVPGGMFSAAPPFGVIGMADWGTEYLSEEMLAKRFGVDKYPLYNFGFKVGQPDMCLEQMETGVPYPIKAAWIQTTNFLACTSPDPKRTQAAFEKLDFNVVVDLFMTPTAVALADIVLPATTFAERDGMRTFWQPIEIINKAIEPVGDTRSDMQICMDLGKRFRSDMWPWDTVQDMFTEMLAPSGLTWEELREVAPPYPPYEYRKHEKGHARFDGGVGFNTPTGRIELYCAAYESWGIDPLPAFTEPDDSPVSSPDLYAEYPLVLTTGARSWSSFHSEHRQIPHLRALKPDPVVEIHPDAAAKYRVKDGDWVWLENQRGRARRKVVVTPIMDPRVVNTDHGWWLPETEGAAPNLYGIGDVNINNLVPWGAAGATGFGANYKSMLCKIYKVAEGEM